MSSNNPGPPLVSSSTTTALMLTYRPIIFLLFAGPAIILSITLIPVISRVVLDYVTNQHTLLAICMTIFFSKTIENLILKAAPTKEKAIKSVEKSRGWLSYFMIFVTNVFIIRLIVIPLEDVLGLKDILTWSPSLSFSTAIRFACGGLLLGLSVVARYIGPQSVVRCSSSPLMVNPYTKTFRNIIGTSTVLNTLNLPDICKPDDVKKSKQQKLPEQRDRNPRRLQLPTSASLIAQIAISILIAVAVAFTTVLPFSSNGNLSDNNHSPMKMALILMCITSTSMQLLLTTLNGTNHEIDPRKYRSYSVRNPVNIIPFLIKSAAPIIIFIPLYILTISIYAKYDSLKWSDNLVCLIAVPPVIFLYLSIFDYNLRIFFCTTPSNIKKLVEEASGGDARMEVFLDVVLRNLLHSDDELVKKLGNNSSTRSSVWMDLEQEEQKRNDFAITTMADILLHKSSKDEAGPHLEDDILRLAILSSIGGSRSSEGGSSSTEPYAAMPIVRALCAYAGGIGKALLIIAGSNNKMLSGDEWVLPPAAIYMAECAIRGASRCILHSLNLASSSSSSSVMRGKNTSLSILIPVLLSSAFVLENGVVRFAEAIGGPMASNETDKRKLLQTVSPELLSLFNIINDSTRMIIESATANEGLRKLDLMESLDMDCQKWLRSKKSYRDKIIYRIPFHTWTAKYKLATNAIRATATSRYIKKRLQLPYQKK